MNSNFELKILDLHWVNEDEQFDRCAHGKLFIKIGDEIISDEDGLDITVSSTALYLMRTISYNYKKDDFASQLLPCCGHFIIADENDDYVNICGCPSGIDWTIIHLDDNTIKHITENGAETTIHKNEYKKIVIDFADNIELFYKNSLPKIIPQDEFTRKGYLTFWKEWKQLRNNL